MKNNIIKTEKDFQVEPLPEVSTKPTIIGFSGKAGSGKDTAAGYLGFKLQNEEYDWGLFRFANSLKKFVASLLGCSMKDLENREFKETPLGEEWWYWKHNSMFNYDIIPYLPIKKAVPIPTWFTLVKTTPRILLQTIGTDAMRLNVHPDIWVNATMKKIENYKKELAEFSTTTSIAIITDVRFKNEVEAIERAGGIVIRIERTQPKSGREHESETQLDDYKFKYVIPNNEGFDALEERLTDLWESL